LESVLEYFFLACIALLAGVLIGSVGVGGVLLIPALLAVTNLSIHQASASALITFILTGALGTYLFARRGSIAWGMSVPICLGAVIAGYLGAQVNVIVAPQLLIGIIGLMVIGAGIWALMARIPVTLGGHDAVSNPPKRRAILFAVGLVSGFLSGLSGAGGPLFSVPLMLALKFNPLATIGVAQVFQVVASGSGSVANIVNGVVDFKIVAFIVPFELIGICIGVVIAHKTRVDRLKKVAAGLCILVGIYMTIKSFI
jgi:uncharacterized membrane protein YfcA